MFHLRCDKILLCTPIVLFLCLIDEWSMNEKVYTVILGYYYIYIIWSQITLTNLELPVVAL